MVSKTIVENREKIRTLERKFDFISGEIHGFNQVILETINKRDELHQRADEIKDQMNNLEIAITNEAKQ